MYSKILILFSFLIMISCSSQKTVKYQYFVVNDNKIGIIDLELPAIAFKDNNEHGRWTIFLEDTGFNYSHGSYNDGNKTGMWEYIIDSLKLEIEWPNNPYNIFDNENEIDFRFSIPVTWNKIEQDKYVFVAGFPKKTLDNNGLIFLIDIINLGNIDIHSYNKFLIEKYKNTDTSDIRSILINSNGSTNIFNIFKITENNDQFLTLEFLTNYNNKIIDIVYRGQGYNEAIQKGLFLKSYPQ